MPVDFDILRKLNSTPERIRQIATATEGEDLVRRKALETEIEFRIQRGAKTNLDGYQFYAASDLAWDSNTITKMTVPLQMYCQGKVQLEHLKGMLKDLSPDLRKKITETNERGDVTEVKIPEFFQMSFNLVRSLVTRRTAAIVGNYVGQFPFMKYEPMDTGFVAKLRGDALSQRIEMCTNQFGYRHDLGQVIREMLLYSHVVEFVEGAWDVEKSLRKKRTTGVLTADPSQFETESYVVREGVSFVRPHPTRVFYDISKPLTSLNTDTGLEYIGYWNVVPIRSIRDNPHYFNRENISYSGNINSLLTGYRGFWELYFPTAPVNFPSAQNGMELGQANSREAQLGKYPLDDDSLTVVVTEYFVKVIPQNLGIGDYPQPVWMRLVVAGGKTIVYGEFLPDTPGVVYSYNVADGRLLNNSFAHDALQFQDQVSNMLTHMLHTQKASLIKLIALDIDLINDPKVLKALREIISSDGIYSKPLVVEYKGAVYAGTQLDPSKVINVQETNGMNDVTMFLRSIMQVLNLADRALGVSANESAQSEPREISATESSNIATTVNTTLNFVSMGIDEGLDAKKRLLYNSFMSKGTSRVQLPVSNRYTEATIRAAGFEIVPDGADPIASNVKDGTLTILGTKDRLEYEYTFSSRDGSQRASNSKAAEILTNLLAQFNNIPGFVQHLGQDRLYTLLNEIVRLSGAGVDLRFESKQGDSELPPHDGLEANKEEVQKAIEQILNALQADRNSIAQIQQVLGMGAPQGAPAGAPPQAAPPAGLLG